MVLLLTVAVVMLFLYGTVISYLSYIFRKRVSTDLSELAELRAAFSCYEPKADAPENVDAFKFILGAAKDRPADMSKLIRTCIKEDGFSSGKKNYTGYQKVAIFLIAIGAELSNEIYKYLREDEIETITFEITRIEYVDHNDKMSVVQEFYEQLVGYKFISVGGIEYARDILEKSLGTQKAIDIINRLNSNLQIKPFDFIRRAVPLHLLTLIQQEHPQVIALVLSYLEPNKASVILENLPNDLQSDVARRIAKMDRTSPEILREIERVLEKKLSTFSSEDYTVAGGVESIVEILNLVDRTSEKQIVEALEDEDPELAEEIKKRMFVFEDVIMLDDMAIQKLMREVDSQELALALKSVDTEVQDKIFKNMSQRAATMLKEDMEYMGPVRLKQVEEVQQKIVSIIRHLEDIGEIVIVRPGEDEIIN